MESLSTTEARPQATPTMRERINIRSCSESRFLVHERKRFHSVIFFMLPWMISESAGAVKTVCADTALRQPDGLDKSLESIEFQ